MKTDSLTIKAISFLWTSTERGVIWDGSRRRKLPEWLQFICKHV